MTIIKGAQVARPQTTPIRSSVLDHATVVENVDHFRLQNNTGLWSSYNCMDTLVPTELCPEPTEDKVFSTVGWVPGFEFAVYGAVQCNLVGLDRKDQKSEVERVFRLNEGRGIERALLENRFVANAPLQFLAAPVMSAASTAAVGGTLAAGTYFATVTAVNAEGETTESNEVSITTVGATSTVTFSWADLTGETGYRLWVTSGAAGSETHLIDLAADTVSFTWTGAPAPGVETPPAANTAALPDVPGIWDAPDDLTPATAITLPVALALLEGYARTIYAGVPTIHMPAAAASLLGSDKIVWEDGLAYTRLGSKVAMGGGYDDGSIPMDPTWDLYATGEVYVERGAEVSIATYELNGAVGATFDSNTGVALVERAYRVAVDCFVAKATGTIWS